MITKEYNLKKYCCFYVSDFHLEMILLPYIKNNINKSKIIINSQRDLRESIKLLLERTNLNEEEKNKIYKLNWTNERKEEIYNCEEITLIRIGNNDYITQMNQNLKNINVKNVNIIDCYNINEENIEIAKIKENYEKVLNTKNLEK